MAPTQCTRCNKVFASKAKCSRWHAEAADHTALPVFRCLECQAIFVQLKELKLHRTQQGHTRNTLTVSHLPPPYESTSDAGLRAPAVEPGPKSPKCLQCQRHFDTWHEWAAHRRSAHGSEEPPVTLRCPRCLGAIAFGENHPHCVARKNVACLVCRQKFSHAAELDLHLTEYPVSCDLCATHLPPPMTLQDHWNLSIQHPFCKMCNSGFKDAKAWAAHTLECSLATRPLVPGNIGVISGKWGRNVAKEDKSNGSERLDGARGRDDSEVTLREPVGLGSSQWFLSGLPQAASLLDQVSPRGSSASTSSKGIESSEHATQCASEPACPSIDRGQPEPGIVSIGRRMIHPEGDDAFNRTRSAQIEDYVSDTQLVEILACEYGQHSVERILSVLDDEEPADKPRKARSLLSPSRPSIAAPASMLGGESVTPSSGDGRFSSERAGIPSALSSYSAWDISDSDKEGHSGSPLMPGYRCDVRKPTIDSIDALPEMSSASQVTLWLDDLAGHMLTGEPLLPLSRTHTPPGYARPPGRVAETDAAPGTSEVSWRCSLCLRQPRVEPVATYCGHVFCHSCIMQELSNHMSCPICKATYFVRLRPSSNILA
ncbi:hypothetical protein BV20DRAFT_157883 [Pilatotrama ljubarskyi]|nr:hypothetical protein BV20DRAFT_157883 [Pilatotrama ljubarskyi]